MKYIDKGTKVVIAVAVSLIIIIFIALGIYLNSKNNTDNKSEASQSTKVEQSSNNSSKKEIDVNFSKENAKRALVVAASNAIADDVFSSKDGNKYDPSKFHTYSSTSGNYLHDIPDSICVYTAESSDTWSIFGLDCYSYYGGKKQNRNYEIRGDVTWNGKNYLISDLSISYVTYRNGDPDDIVDKGAFPLMVKEGDAPLVVSPKMIK